MDLPELSPEEYGIIATLSNAFIKRDYPLRDNPYSSSDVKYIFMGMQALIKMDKEIKS